MTLLLVDPFQIPHRHAVPVEECAFDLEVDFGAVVTDVPDIPDRFRTTGDDLITDLGDTLLHTLPAKLLPVGMRLGDVVATTEGAVAPLAIDADDLVCADELPAQGAGIPGGGQGREHALSAVHNGIVEFLCFSCGESALGVATDGRPYCHRVTCCNWKAERWKAMQMRRRA